MLGLTFEKLVLVAIVAGFVLGPERLPLVAARIAAAVRALRGHTDRAREQVRRELGPELADTDWAALDPRRYDPRRIIRDALADEPGAAHSGAAPHAVTLSPAAVAPPAAEPVVASEPVAAAEPGAEEPAAPSEPAGSTAPADPAEGEPAAAPSAPRPRRGSDGHLIRVPDAVESTRASSAPTPEAVPTR